MGLTDKGTSKVTAKKKTPFASKNVTVKKQYFSESDTDRMKWLKGVILYITTQRGWQIWYEKDDLRSAANYYIINGKGQPGPYSNPGGFGPNTDSSYRHQIENRRNTAVDKAIKELIADGQLKTNMFEGKVCYARNNMKEIDFSILSQPGDFGASSAMSRTKIVELSALQNITLRPITHRELNDALNKIASINGFNNFLSSGGITISISGSHNNWTATSVDKTIQMQITLTDHLIKGNNILETVAKVITKYQPSYIERFIKTITGLFRRG